MPLLLPTSGHLATMRASTNRIGQPPQNDTRTILLLEDDSACAARQRTPGHMNDVRSTHVRVHRIDDARAVCLGTSVYSAKPRSRGAKVRIAIRLLERVLLRRKQTIVIAGPYYGQSPEFSAWLSANRIEYVLEVGVRYSVAMHVDVQSRSDSHSLTAAGALLHAAPWLSCSMVSPQRSLPQTHLVAELGHCHFAPESVARLFACQTGGIHGVHRGTRIGVTTLSNYPLDYVVRLLAWVRWVRLLRKSYGRARSVRADVVRHPPLKTRYRYIKARPSIRSSLSQDEAVANHSSPQTAATACRGELRASRRALNLIELFAGAGGMSLGFLLSNCTEARYRLRFSADIDSACVETLRLNHRLLARHEKPRLAGGVIMQADLSMDSVLKQVSELSSTHVTDVLIGGPPCQGFSMANRNSWTSSNPHNSLVDVFMQYLSVLNPRVFVMENVQGMLWTPRRSKRSSSDAVAAHVVKRARGLGYVVFPKLLDAAWYGVPQHRTRLFILGIRSDLGYAEDDFGEWGPYPRPSHGPGTGRPYVTVWDAIGDLPPVENGHSAEITLSGSDHRNSRRRIPFLQFVRSGAPRGVALDHVVSRHADYVIDRYRNVPEGGNWRSIAHMLTNYVDPVRTHSNIYRRLSRELPSVTVGHYRKSMIIHPTQHRGLSLREAARLQSFPDWFRFSGGPRSSLARKQQQLGNAVSPLLAKAISEFIASL